MTITGDAHEVAGAVAPELHVDEVFAEVLPDDKDRAIGAILMSAATVVVAFNAQLLRRLDLRPNAPSVDGGTLSPSARHAERH